MIIKSERNNILNKTIFKTDFIPLAYNSCLGWTELEDGYYGLSIKGIVIGNRGLCKKII